MVGKIFATDPTMKKRLWWTAFKRGVEVRNKEERMPYILTDRALSRVFHPLGPGQRFCADVLAFVGICGLVLCMLMPTGSVLAEDQIPDNSEPPSIVARAVLDIISYARWPMQPDAYRLCVAGRTAYLRNMPVQANVVAGHPVQLRDLELRSDLLLSSCDVVYIGSLRDDLRKMLLTYTRRRPILTIDEQGANYADGAMFSLRVHDNRFSVQVNLDAISRSGIRINPNVLLLGRRKSVQP